VDNGKLKNQNKKLFDLLDKVASHHYNTAMKLKNCGLTGVMYWYHCARHAMISSRISEIKND